MKTRRDDNHVGDIISADIGIRRELSEMGVDVYNPQTPSEETLAARFGDFADFVLSEAKESCLDILETDLRFDGGSVGELQGGNDKYKIYRASFPSSTSDKNKRGEMTMSKKKGNKRSNNINRKATDEQNAFMQLLELYNRNRRDNLTTEDIESYMLGMCSRRARERNTGDYDQLGNCMIIIQFGGPTVGQVRHIDNMVPNLQICLYMSRRCPSTIVYEIDDGGSPVIDGASLLEYWQCLYSVDDDTDDDDGITARRGEAVPAINAATTYSVDDSNDDEQCLKSNNIVPDLVRTILLDHGDINLSNKWYTRYFAFWDTINSQLLCFGKLYQPVARALGLTVEPGTTLLAGGNEIHGGPPTTESRMFAFAIGIPDQHSRGEEIAGDDDDSLLPENDGRDEENDGEVQYSPVLLHIDFCCLLFSMLDFEFGSNANLDLARREAKYFLVNVLIDLIRDYPMRQYLIQIHEERTGVLTWLECILKKLEDGSSISALVEEAVDSDDILYTPDVIKRKCKKKKASMKAVERVALVPM